MTVRLAALAASTGLALAATLVAAPADAQEPEPELLPLTITPTSGPGGTVIRASGTDCAPLQPSAAFIQVYFADEDEVFAAVEGTVWDNGTWLREIPVPGDANPTAAYSVFATCFVDIGDSTERAAEYEAQPFSVSGPAAAPAAPVPGAPVFTG